MFVTNKPAQSLESLGFLWESHLSSTVGKSKPIAASITHQTCNYFSSKFQTCMAEVNGNIDDLFVAAFSRHNQRHNQHLHTQFYCTVDRGALFLSSVVFLFMRTEIQLFLWGISGKDSCF